MSYLRSVRARPESRFLIRLLLILSVALVAAATQGVVTAQEEASDTTKQSPAVFNRPTYSSPIAMSADNTLVWVVNPDDDSVSVIRTDTNVLIRKINVGDEPQSIAVDPNNTFAYVANAAGSDVTVIRITSANPATFVASVDRQITTGAEPWNIVISPDGKRVFVANSSQDTISVINAENRNLIGHINIRNSICNDPDRNRHFQPRGLAVTQDNTKLYVTRFLSFTKTGGVQGNDNGREGIVCQFTINTSSTALSGYNPSVAIPISSRVTGFTFPNTVTDTLAFPNQMQSVVIRGDNAYLPNIAASPSGPLRFNLDTHAFVNVLGGVNGTAPADESATKFVNLHLGARGNNPKIFFANPWAIAFTNQSGEGAGYVVSAGSDGLVKVDVAADGTLSLTESPTQTLFIDLNDPDDPATSGVNAGKNPLGIVINDAGTTAYTMNYISRNVSVVDLTTESVSKVIKLTDLPPAGSFEEILHVGKEIFFASRGVFNELPGTTVSTQDRLSSEGWQNCGSCHFAGLTDGIIWTFAAGPRKSVPMAGTWSPTNPDDQRILNYSAIFDEVEDFEINIRNVSGPGPLAAPLNGTTNDPNHGLLFGDNINLAPGVVNSLTVANANRPQHTVTLPGSTEAIPALTAMREWVRFGIRTPNGPLSSTELTGGVNQVSINTGRALFTQVGCHRCHGGTKWTNSTKDFISPPPGIEIFTERSGTFTGNPVGAQYLDDFLEDVGSFNLGVAGQGNDIGNNIGAPEVASGGADALGRDYNNDGFGNGFNIPSLLGILNVPPYYHNGACETLACVVSDVEHRTAGLLPNQTDPLTSPSTQALLVAFLESIDAQTAPPINLRLDGHNIFFDPPTIFVNTTVTVGANIQLFGPQIDAFSPGPLKVSFFDGTNLIAEADLVGFDQDFGQTTVAVAWNTPATAGTKLICIEVDSTNIFVEDNENDNRVCRAIIVRNPPPDRTPPTVSNVLIEDGAAFTSSSLVDITFQADDPQGPNNEQVSGLSHFCIVRYTYSTPLRIWVPQACVFRTLPAPESGNTYRVQSLISAPDGGVAYTFVWVRDRNNNISRFPGFDFINLIPAGNIFLTRNNVRIFRFTLEQGQTATFTATPTFGDIDLFAFRNTNPTPPDRVAVSANIGAVAETVTVTATSPGNTLFQIEVHPFANTRFQINATGGRADLAAMSGDVTIAASNTVTPTAPFIFGPPALQAAIDSCGLGGDVDDDTDVDAADIQLIAGAWNTEDIDYDLNASGGVVDIVDILTSVQDFGQGCVEPQ